MTQPMNDSIEVKLELGHKAVLKTGYNPEGYTHDWKLFVRGPEGCNIQHFIEKVVFHLHSTFPKPKRVLKEPPYEVQECGYAGFHVPIDIYFKNKNDPKKLQFMYDLFLRVDEQVNHIRCEKLTFQNPSDDFRKRLLLSGGVSKSADAPKEGSNKKSPVQAVPPALPKSTFTDIFGTPDVAIKQKKKSSEKEKSSTPKLSKSDSSSTPSKPDVSPAPGSGNHSNKIIDLTTEKSQSSSSGSSKHKHADKSKSSSSHKDSKHRHSSESRGSSKPPSDKRSDSQDKLHPGHADKTNSHDRRSGSHEKSHHSGSSHEKESSSEKHHGSKSHDRSYSSSEKKSSSHHEKHSHNSSSQSSSSSSSHEKKSHSKLNDSRSSNSHEKQEKIPEKHSQESRSGSHEKHASSKSNSSGSHSSSSHNSEKLDRSHSSSGSKSGSKRPAEENSLPKEEYVSKKKKKKDKDREKDSEKESKAFREERVDREKVERKEKMEKEHKRSKEKEKEKERLSKEKEREDRQKEKVEERSHQKHKSGDSSRTEREKKEEKRSKIDRKEEDRNLKFERGGVDFKRQGSSKEEKKEKKVKSRPKDEGHDDIQIIEEVKEVKERKPEREHKVVKEQKKSGKKRKKYEDPDSVLSDSDDSLADGASFVKKKKKKQSHKSKSYPSPQVQKKNISDIYTDSDEEGEVKDSPEVKVKQESPPLKVKVESSPEPAMKSGGKKRSGEGAGGREKKSTKDYMKDLFYSSDEESVKEAEPEMKKEAEFADSDGEVEPGEYTSDSHSDSEEGETKLSDVESEDEVSQKTKSHSKKSDKSSKSVSKPVPQKAASKSIFSNDIFSTGEHSDSDPFGDDGESAPHEPSNSFKENTKPPEKLLSDLDTGSESSMDDEDILSPMENNAPVFSPRKPPPSSVTKSPRVKHESSTPSHKSPKLQKSSPRTEPPLLTGHSPIEKHRSPAARGGKGPDNHTAQKMKSAYNQESRVEVQKESSQGGRREKGSIIANKSPKVNVGKLLSDSEEGEEDMDLGSDSNDENDDNMSVSSAALSSAAESGENSDSDDSDHPVDDQGGIEEDRTEKVEISQKEVKKEPERGKFEITRERVASMGNGGKIPPSSSPQSNKDRERMKLEQAGLLVGPAGDSNNAMRRSDTGIFTDFTDNSDNIPPNRQSGVEESPAYSTCKRKSSPTNLGASNVARVEPLVRDKVNVTPTKKGGSTDGGVRADRQTSGMNKEGAGGGNIATGEDVYSKKAPNGENLGSLLDLQKKLYSIMNNKELLNNIVKIIMKDDTFYSITDTTFDFDLCRLDKGTLNKIQGFLQTAV